ncbi:hypothetical protein ACFONN_10270 [Dyella humi]|uniref:Uncharacterized protein n=1 Tax=Dyella humi TaxID=1770547 RepID=A0ABW8IKY5_9GAMM
MTAKPSRAIRPDFAEPWHRDDLRARYDYHTEITGPEAAVILGWSTDQLKTHHKNHPNRPPRKLAKENAKGWNHYFLGEVLDALEERTLWLLKQRGDQRPLTEVQKANREATRERRRQLDRAKAAADAWFKTSTFSKWLAHGRGDDEWPVVVRSDGKIEDLMAVLGTTGPDDEVRWLSLSDYVEHLARRVEQVSQEGANK